MQKMDKSIVNFTNKVNILRILWENSSVFRAEIARMTNLSHPTVMKIVDELIGENLVNITGKGVSSGGKPPLMLEMNKDAYYVIGVDINEYRIEILLVNLQLGIEDKRIQDNRATDTVESIMERIIAEIKDLFDKNMDKADRILGIGVGIPGLVDAKKGFVIYSPELQWRNVDVKSWLAEEFEGEIFIDESTRAFAMEEKMFGEGKGIRNFLCINIGSGIGSALVMDGKLYYGNVELSGQLGHMSVVKDGMECVCGNHGCLELYASGKAIEERAKALVDGGKPTMIRDLVYGKSEKIDVNIVFEAARNGDVAALEILKTAADYLGMAVAGAINFIDPEMIIFEGKVSRTGQIFMDMFKKSLRSRKMKFIGRDIKVVAALDKNCTVSLGAAAFIVNGFIQRGGRVSARLSCVNDKEDI